MVVLVFENVGTEVREIAGCLILQVPRPCTDAGFYLFTFKKFFFAVVHTMGHAES